MWYETKHKETQRKQTISQCTSKKWPFKSHDVPTAQQLRWFREDRVWKEASARLRIMLIYVEKIEKLGAILIPVGFWNGVPNRHFLKKCETNKKKEVQEVALKTHDLLIDFWC